MVGFDRLTRWHRWNGHACIDLVIAHVVLTVWGYALLDKLTLGKEISTMLGGVLSVTVTGPELATADAYATAAFAMGAAAPAGRAGCLGGTRR